MRRCIDEQLVKRLYLEEGLSTIEIGKRLGFSDAGVGAALRRLGVPLHPRTFWPKTSGRPAGDPLERIYAKIELSECGCWLWQGVLDQHGYGRFWLAGKSRLAHRVVYELVTGEEIPAGLTIHHECETRQCVNPAHLSPVTQAENQARRRKCTCGSCARCRHRDYMREWSRRNAAKVRARVARYHKLKRATS